MTLDLWQRLSAHQAATKDRRILSMFENDKRVVEFSV